VSLRYGGYFALEILCLTASQEKVRGLAVSGEMRGLMLSQDIFYEKLVAEELAF
jgi:hypothetical protein